MGRKPANAPLSWQASLVVGRVLASFCEATNRNPIRGCRLRISTSTECRPNREKERYGSQMFLGRVVHRFRDPFDEVRDLQIIPAIENTGQIRFAMPSQRRTNPIRNRSIAM